MDFDLFKRVIEQIKGKVEYVGLQAYGEPFLNKDIFRMIAYAKDAGLHLGLSTNATVLHEDTINNIFSSKLDYIIIAFDGFQKSTYESIRKGARYEDVVRNINSFLDAKCRRKEKIFTVLQCIYMDATKNEIKDFVRQWHRKGVDGIRIRQVTYSGEGQFRNPRKKPCYWLWHDPYVTCDGTLIPCCQDVNAVYPLGNVTQDSIESLWNSEKMMSLRQLHIKDKAQEVGLCRNCNMYQPSDILIAGSSFPRVFTLNKLIPGIESLLVKIRHIAK